MRYICLQKIYELRNGDENMQFRYQISLPYPAWSSFCNKLSRIDPDVRQRIDQLFSAVDQDICVQHSDGKMTVFVNGGIDEAGLFAALVATNSAKQSARAKGDTHFRFCNQASVSFSSAKQWIISTADKHEPATVCVPVDVRGRDSETEFLTASLGSTNSAA